tara:strand:- start:1073 stop:1885 length:813 start_codon:yes stop_codon:yes gene_type:complete
VEIEFFYFLISLLITGVFSGLIAGLLGVGGGLVVIPVTYYILNFYGYSLDITMHVAIASSIGVICFTSVSSVYSHYKLGNIETEVVKKWFIGAILGSVLGAIFASSINGNLLIITFVLIVSLVALSMYLNFHIVLSNNIPQNFLLNNTISFLIGCFSVLIGIGGGSFTVPTLTIFGKNIHKAIGTSASIGFLIAFPGFVIYVLTGWQIQGLPDYSLGYVSLPIVITVASVSMFTAPLGAKLSNQMNKQTLKYFFATFLLLICVSLVIDQY